MRHLRSGAFVLALVLALVLGGPRVAWSAQAERRPVHLTYARATGAEQCPDEAAFRESVLARLGYDPFDDHAPRSLRVVASRAGSSLGARIELRDESGAPQGARDLKTSGTDCAELAKAMAIAVSLAIDPLSAMPPAPQPPVAPPPPAGPVEVPPPPPGATPEREALSSVPQAEPAPRESPPIRARFSAGGVVSVGVSPAPAAFGVALDAGLGRGMWSLDLEGMGNWAPTRTEGDVGASSSLELLSLVPCVHLGIGLGCILGGAGSIEATGVVHSPETSRAAFADVGVRAGVEIPFARVFFVQLRADGLVILTPETFYTGTTKFWSTSPPLSASFALAFGVTP